jgi:hypothetical protein
LSASVLTKRTHTWSWSAPFTPDICAIVGGPCVSGTNVWFVRVTVRLP